MTTLTPTHHFEVNYEVDELSEGARMSSEHLHENEFASPEDITYVVYKYGFNRRIQRCDGGGWGT